MTKSEIIEFMVKLELFEKEISGWKKAGCAGPSPAISRYDQLELLDSIDTIKTVTEHVFGPEGDRLERIAAEVSS